MPPARTLPLLLVTLLAGCAPTGPEVDPPEGDADTDTDADTDSDADSDADTDTAAPWPAGLTVLEPVRVVDADGVREGMAVAWAGAEIAAVVPAGTSWPEDATVLDGTGLTVLPGLVDTHVHLAHAGTTWWVGDTLAANLRATLAWGVTSVVDLGSPLWLVDVRDRVAAGTLLGPSMKVSGPFLTAEGSHPCETTDDPDLCRYVDGDAAAEVAALRAAGVDHLKVALADADFTEWPAERLDLGDLAAIVAAAGDLPVVAHTDEVQDVEDALAAGIRNIAHPPFDAALADASALHGVEALQTTVSAFQGTVRVVGEGDDLAGDRYRTVPERVREAWTTVQAHPEILVDGWVAANRRWLDAGRGSLATALAGGVTVEAGSDAGYWFVPHGAALHDELAALVDLGATPLQAIAAATSVPAGHWGWTDRGHVAPGYRADLLVVRGDPSVDITATRAVVQVVVGGVAWTQEALAAADVLLVPAEAPPGSFCLDDRDCAAGRCDLVDHACNEACDPPYATAGVCDGTTWCSPVDGLSTTTEGVCHVGDGCDLYAQDCAPPSYAEACVPADLDTTSCVASGPRLDGESCSWTDVSAACAPGLYCSPYTYRCYTLCDPAGAATCTRGRCLWQYAADGSPWFGLCL